jgi:rhodanese-related sulfurtransferase
MPSANRVLAATAGLLATLALIAGDTLAPGGAGEIGALDVARRLRSDPDGIRILDVRGDSAFADFHLPRARHAALADAAHLEAWVAAARAGGASEGDLVVIVGGPGIDARRPWLALKKAGFSDVRYMRDAVTDWLESIISPILGPDADDEERSAFEEQAEIARYFGGFPRILTAAEAPGGDVSERLRKARRRGCAF